MAAAASQAASLAGLHPASWWSMAQFAAQDYFARLSGLPQLPFTAPGLGANFPSGLPNLSGAAGASSSNTTSNSGGSNANNSNNSSGNNRNNNSSGGGGSSKSKKKNSSNNSNNSNRDSPMKNSLPSLGSGSGGPSSGTPPSLPDYKALYSRSNFQKELLAMAAAQSAVGLSISSSPSGTPTKHSPYLNEPSGSGSRSTPKDRDTPSKSRHSISISPAPSSASSSHSQRDTPKNDKGSSGSSARTSKNQHTAKDRTPNEINFDTSLSISALNSLSQLGNLGNLTSQQSVTAAMNALAASSTKAKDYMSSGILR